VIPGTISNANSWLATAQNDLDRANKLKESDFAGAIEAAQMAIEKAIKSMYALVNIPIPKTHDAVFEKGKDRFIEVVERLHFPLEYVAIQRRLLRFRWLGPMWGWANNVSRYGYEPANAPPSALFTQVEANNACQYAAEAVITAVTIISHVTTGDIIVRS